MVQRDLDVFDRLERFYDAVPRDGAVAEDIGGLVLFVRRGPGWPFYARPRLAAEAAPSAADITAVRQRQLQLGVPEAFEWMHERHPDLLTVARSAGLSVLMAPLMVLDSAALLPDLPPPGATVRLLDPASAAFGEELAAARAVARLGFEAPRTGGSAGSSVELPADGAPVPLADLPISGTRPAGPAERDAVDPPTHDEVADERRRAASGLSAVAVAVSPADGVLASGVLLRVDAVAEIAGVATLPSARGRGYASQLTAALARHALADGVDLVFLSAGDDDTARLYSRVGFRRIGTACVAHHSTA